MSWEYEDTVKLINLYKETPGLWDPEHAAYSNYHLRANLERDIARNFKGRSTGDIKRKLKSLRCMYYRSYKKTKEKKKNKNLWFGYKLMSFLGRVYDKDSGDDGTSEMKTTVAKIEECDSDESDNDDEEDDDENDVNSRELWKQEDLIKLMDLYKEHPELWDTSHERYHNKYMTLNAIKSMASELNKEPPEIRVKLKSLRTVFFRSQKRIKNDMEKYGEYRRKLWFGYKRMSFLSKDNFLTNTEDTQDNDEVGYEHDGPPEDSNNEEPSISYCWTQSKADKLIDMYKNHPELWDPDHIDFNDKRQRNYTLEQFSTTLNILRTDLEGKIRNLRTQYKRQHKKILLAEKNNGQYTGAYWCAYNKMGFLAKLYEPTGENSMNENDGDATDNYYDDDDSKVTLKKEINKEPLNHTDDDGNDNDCSDSWSQNSVKRLMDMYKEHPELWDKQHEMYYNNYMRRKAYKTISDAFGKSEAQVQAKLKILRTIFYRTQDKIRKAVQERGKFSRKLWSGYKVWSFLDKDNLLRYVENPEDNDESEPEDIRDFWEENRVRHLIELYRKHPILWNTRDKEYKNLSKKKRIVKHIAKTLEKNPQVVRTKFKNLRSIFWRCHKSITKGSKKRNIWHLYKQMSFIADTHRGEMRVPEKSSVKQEQIHDDSGDGGGENEDDDDEDDYFDDNNDATNGESVFQDVSMKRDWCEIELHDDPLQPSPNKKCRNEVANIKTEIQIEENIEVQPTEDANVFAQFVAQEMSKITDQCLLTQAKIEITQTIFKAQMDQASKNSK